MHTSVKFTCKSCGVSERALPNSPLAIAELCSKCYRKEVKAGRLTPVYKKGMFQGFKEVEP